MGKSKNDVFLKLIMFCNHLKLQTLGAMIASFVNKMALNWVLLLKFLKPIISNKLVANNNSYHNTPGSLKWSHEHIVLVDRCTVAFRNIMRILHSQSPITCYRFHKTLVHIQNSNSVPFFVFFVFCFLFKLWQIFRIRNELVFFFPF